MTKHIGTLLLMFSVAALLLTACNDTGNEQENTISTDIAQQVALTLTAQATPTLTPNGIATESALAQGVSATLTAVATPGPTSIPPTVSTPTPTIALAPTDTPAPSTPTATTTPTNTPFPPTSTLIASRPSSGRIVFLSYRGATPEPGRLIPHYELFVMEADGSHQTALTTQAKLDNTIGSLSVSPDGQHVLLDGAGCSGKTGASGVMVWDCPGLVHISLSQPEPVSHLLTGKAASMTWSPDGRRIAYSWFGEPEAYQEQIVVANADGSDPTPLTSGTARHLFVDWSPDGQTLAYMEDYSLWQMNTDGSNKRLVIEGQDIRHITWSPSGEQIAFEAGNVWPSDPNAPANQDIWLANANGSNLRNLTNSPEMTDAEPNWSPDGTWIVYSSGKQFSQEYHIYKLNVNSGETVQLTSTGTNLAPFWID